MASKDSFVCCSYTDTNRHETDSVLKRGSAKTLSCLICLNRTFAFTHGALWPVYVCRLGQLATVTPQRKLSHEHLYARRTSLNGKQNK